MRKRRPAEPWGMVKLVSSASAMSEQLASVFELHDCHWYSYSMIGVPVQCPTWVTNPFWIVSVLPTCVLPAGSM
jgi:hypothetical protein